MPAQKVQIKEGALVQKVTRPMGLNLRASDIERDPSAALLVKNVELDSSGDLRTRLGYENTADLPPQTFDLVEYEQGKELIAFTAFGLFRLEGGKFVEIPYMGTDTRPVWTTAPSTAEHKGVLYFTDPDGAVPLFKYDGVGYYRAGVPKAKGYFGVGTGDFKDAPDTLPAIQTFYRENFLSRWRLILAHTDNQGNTTFGDYVDLTLDSPTGAVPDAKRNIEVRTRLSPESESQGGQEFLSKHLFQDIYQHIAIFYLVEDSFRVAVATGNPQESAAMAEKYIGKPIPFRFVKIAKKYYEYDSGKKEVVEKELEFPFSSSEVPMTVDFQAVADFEFAYDRALGNLDTGNNSLKYNARDVTTEKQIGYQYSHEIMWLTSTERTDNYFTFPLSHTEDEWIVPVTVQNPWTLIIASGLVETNLGISSVREWRIINPESYRPGFEEGIAGGPVSNTSLSVSITVTRVDIRNTLSSKQFLDTFYLSTPRKLLPPLCRYIIEHQGLLIAGNLAKRIAGAAEGLGDSVHGHTLYWSSTPEFAGSSVETFNALAAITIGESREGVIRGMYSEQNSLVIFKEKEVYGINGLIITVQFRPFKYQTNEIGCIAHRSIRKIAGGCVFLSERGFHSLGGEGIRELSDVIEPFFTGSRNKDVAARITAMEGDGIDWTTAKTIHNVKDEKFYIIAGKIILIYDYKYQTWFIFQDVPVDGGPVVFGNEFYYAGGGKLFRRKEELKEDEKPSDDGKTIDSRYMSGWFSSFSPEYRGIIKRITIAGEEMCYRINSFANWDTQKKINPELRPEKKLKPPFITKDNSLPAGDHNAVAIEIVSDNMAIKGFVVDMAVAQVVALT